MDAADIYWTALGGLVALSVLVSTLLGFRYTVSTRIQGLAARAATIAGSILGGLAWLAWHWVIEPRTLEGGWWDDLSIVAGTLLGTIITMAVLAVRRRT